MNNTFFNENEKELLLKQLQQNAIQSGAENAYEQFINECRTKKYSENDIMEQHHIIPRHAGGTDEQSNLINLSIKDHVFAHWLRWQLFNSIPDKRAYEFRVSISTDRTKLQRQLILDNVEKYKQERLYRFNSEYQSEMGKRGGSIGGSKNTPAQFKARQTVGLTYGRIGGMKNQGEVLQNTICNYTLWHYKGCKKENNTYESLKTKGKKTCPSGEAPVEFAVVIQPKKAFIDIAYALEIFAPASINMKNISL